MKIFIPAYKEIKQDQNVLTPPQIYPTPCIRTGIYTMKTASKDALIKKEVLGDKSSTLSLTRRSWSVAHLLEGA